MHITFMTFIHNSIIHCIFSISQNVCFQITGVNHTYSYEYKSVPSRISLSREIHFLLSPVPQLRSFLVWNNVLIDFFFPVRSWIEPCLLFTKLNIQQFSKDLPCYSYHFADNW